MASNNESDNSTDKTSMNREELREHILKLQWSLAHKTRENKKLQGEVDDFKAENAALTAENDSLKGCSGNSNNESSAG